MDASTIAAIVQIICALESGGNHTAINVHDGGSPSYGKCQLKAATARSVGYTGPITELWLNPSTNQAVAEQYFRYCLDKANGNLRKALALWNCGYETCNNRRYQNRVIAASMSFR